MFNYDGTLILFGRSPFVNRIKNKIPQLIKNYHTMGCNYFCESFPSVEYVIFYDDIVPKVNANSTIITNVEHYRNKNKQCYELCHTHKKIEFYTINRNSEEFSLRDSTLNFCVHTPSIALNWAYKKGFKNVIIAGIDLSSDISHFEGKNAVDADKMRITNSLLERARKHLTSVAVKYLNIFQLNSNNDMDLQRISIKDLI